MTDAKLAVGSNEQVSDNKHVVVALDDLAEKTRVYKDFRSSGTKLIGSSYAFCDCDYDDKDVHSLRAKEVAKILSMVSVNKTILGEFAVLEENLRIDSDGLSLVGELLSVDEKSFGLDYDSLRAAISNPDVAKPSPYGDLKTNKTVVDTDIRLAYEIAGPRVRLSRAMTSWLKGICDDTKAQGMFGSKSLVPVLSKLNIYPVGGHFDPHQDTPRPGRVGTLLIELPAKRKGGNLAFRGPWSGKTLTLYQRMDSLKAVLFFGEMIHSVSKVTDGFRVSLSFDLKTTGSIDDIKTSTALFGGQPKFYYSYGSTALEVPELPSEDNPESSENDDSKKEKGSSASAKSASSDKQSDAKLQSEIAEIHKARVLKFEEISRSAVDEIKELVCFDQISEEQKGGPVGIFLNYRYAKDEIQQISRGFSKATDQGIISLLSSVPGCQTIIVPVIISVSHEGTSKTHDVEYFSDVLFEHEDFIDELDSEACVFVDVPKQKHSAVTTVYEKRDPGAEYTGNEARESSDDSTYVAAAVIIRPLKALKTKDTDRPLSEDDDEKLDNSSPNKSFHAGTDTNQSSGEEGNAYSGDKRKASVSLPKDAAVPSPAKRSK